MTASRLHEIVDLAAQRWPDSPALTLDGNSMSYVDLAAATRRAAVWLTAQGVGRGQRVAILGPNQVNIVVLSYACSRIGAIFILLHEQVRGAGLVHILTDAEPALLITDSPEARDIAVTHGTPVTSLARVPLDPAAPPASTGGPSAAVPLSVDPACLIYTSGSTGMPKAVVSTHAQMLFAAQAIQSQLNYRTDDVVYAPLPLSFDYGLYQIFLAALGGAHVWLGTGADIGPVLLRNLRRSRATILPAVPSLAENLAQMVRRYAGAPNLRLLTNTGAVMRPQTLAALRSEIPGLRVQLMFGLTECKRVSIMPPDEDLRRPGACGLPLPGTEVLVLDDDGQPVPTGEIGELVVRGPHVMAGYWRRPELTEQRFPRAQGLFPQLRSGDYGWLDADGYLYFSGRRDDIYKSRGFRVSATEIEAAVCRLPEVEAAAVLPPQDSRPHPVLVVTGKLRPAELLDRLRADLEPYKVPDLCVAVDHMPLTANGKIDRAALAASLD